MPIFLRRCSVTTVLAAGLGGNFQFPVDTDPNPTWSSSSLIDPPGGAMGWEREMGGKGASPALVPVRKDGWSFKNASGGSGKAAPGLLLLGYVGLWGLGLPGGTQAAGGACSELVVPCCLCWW